MEEGIPSSDFVLNGDFVIEDVNGVVRLRLDRETGSIFVNNADGDLVFRLEMPGNNLRLGGHGQDGDLLLFPANASTIGGTAQASLHADSATGSMRLGGNGSGGTVLCRAENGDQTVIVEGGQSRIIIGNEGHAGTLHVRDADGQTTVRIDGDDGNLHLGGGGTDGDVVLHDHGGSTRVHLSGSDQRMEIRDTNGEIVTMIGGDANLRAGSNGRTGNLFLYPADVDNIFNNGDATVSISADNGNLSLGGGPGDGDVILRDGGGATRVHLSASDQRIEISESDGAITAMIGGDANIRVGTNGRSGNVFLFPRDADNIFDNTQASVELNGDAGDVILRNGDCAEEFRLADVADAVPGDVVRLAADGSLCPTATAYDNCVAGVVAGAGGLRPGILLGRGQGGPRAVNVALTGQVYCRADAGPGPIRVGDMLVSAERPGHAMRTVDSARAFGAVIGKAMEALDVGTGLIRVLVCLR